MLLEPVATSKKRPKRRAWRRLGHYSTCFFILFRYFFSLTDIFRLYLDLLDDKQPTFSQIAYLTSPLPCQKKGPNDARRVVWAIIVRVSFISFRYFFSLTDIFSLYLDDKQPTFSQIFCLPYKPVATSKKRPK